MKRDKFKWLAILAVAVIIGVVWLGLSHRSPGQTTAPNDAGTLPTVAVSKVTRQDIFKQVTTWGREQILRNRPRHKIYPRSEDLGGPPR